MMMGRGGEREIAVVLEFVEVDNNNKQNTN